MSSSQYVCLNVVLWMLRLSVCAATSKHMKLCKRFGGQLSQTKSIPVNITHHACLLSSTPAMHVIIIHQHALLHYSSQLSCKNPQPSLHKRTCCTHTSIDAFMHFRYPVDGSVRISVSQRGLLHERSIAHTNLQDPSLC